MNILINPNFQTTISNIDNPLALGQALAKARRSVGLTQEELCRKTSIPYSTLTKIERGVIKKPNVFIVFKIAQATKFKIEDFFIQTDSDSVIAFNNKKTSKSGIKFVYFDIHQTLINSSANSINLMSAYYNIPLKSLTEMYAIYDHRLCLGQISSIDFDAILASHFGLDKIDSASFYIKSCSVNNYVLEACLWAMKHYRVGILTNAFDGNCQNLIRTGILPNGFEIIVDSSQIGLLKPDKAIYTYAQEQTQLKPNQILLVDDRQINILAAQHNGWHGYKVSDENIFNTSKDLKILLEF